MRERVREAERTAACPCLPTSLRATRVTSALRRGKNRDKQRKSRQKKIEKKPQHSMSSVFLKFVPPISRHQQTVGCEYGKKDSVTTQWWWWRHNDSSVCLWLKASMMNYECVYAGVKLNYKKLKQREKEMRRQAKVRVSSVSSLLIWASARWPREWAPQPPRATRSSEPWGCHLRTWGCHVRPSNTNAVFGTWNEQTDSTERGKVWQSG